MVNNQQFRELNSGAKYQIWLLFFPFGARLPPGLLLQTVGMGLGKGQPLSQLDPSDAQWHHTGGGPECRATSPTTSPKAGWPSSSPSSTRVWKRERHNLILIFNLFFFKGAGIANQVCTCACGRFAFHTLPWGGGWMFLLRDAADVLPVWALY